nr:uncharacterized protein LOC112040708 [Quercus suber]
MVANLINPELNIWKYEDIKAIFHTDEVEAIGQIPLSRRNVLDSVFWLHNSRGLFSVKSAYHVVRRLLTVANQGGKLTEGAAKNIWNAIWKLRLPNKIKVFAWRVCHKILPTTANLTKRKVLNDDKCSVCTRETESTIHALWDCAAVQDIWVGSSQKLQKARHGQIDMVHLMEELLERLSQDELKLFWTQAWIVWNQRNCLLHRGQLKVPSSLTNRAEEYIIEFRITQTRIQAEQAMVQLFEMIKERAIEFAVDAGFLRLIVEGDNIKVIHAISSSLENTSPLGNIVDDIRHLLRSLQWVSVCCIRRGGNQVAHVLAQYARNNLDEDIYWMKDSPSPAIDALYRDLSLI